MGRPWLLNKLDLEASHLTRCSANSCQGTGGACAHPALRAPCLPPLLRTRTSLFSSSKKRPDAPEGIVSVPPGLSLPPPWTPPPTEVH